MIKFNTRAVILLLAMSVSLTAYADQHSLPATSDLSEYEPVLSELKQCIACHGADGVTLQPTFPILSGQHFYYLYVQLKDFKSGLRKNNIMSPIAADLSKSQMKLLAKYFSDQKWPAIGFKSDSAAEAKGESATGAGQCVQCHLGGYEGDSRIPRLAGQHPEYLLKTMSDFKHRIRMNSAAKSSLFVSYSEDDIKAMSEYLAGK
ncbi:MAG: cytochrome c553 [Parasphingorhabdus sp.]|jgi:cytochrome c553